MVTTMYNNGINLSNFITHFKLYVVLQKITDNFTKLSKASAKLLLYSADNRLLLCDQRLTLGSRGYFFLIDISRRSRVNEAQSAEEKKITSGHRSTQPHFHARNQFRN